MLDAPKFRVSARAVEVLRTPDEFYRGLKASILGAKRRVFLATLYIGNKETELVETLHTSLERNQDLKVHILSDGLRGTREAPHGMSSASLLTPLISAFPGRVTVSMYRTPAYKGVAKLLPKRFNEGCGLQHMKLYGVDDSIVLSGANLSTDYFTNRQDRYIRIKDKNVTDYFFQVFEGVADLSFVVRPKPGSSTDNFELVKTAPPQKGVAALQKLIDYRPELRPPQHQELDTYVYPLVQLTPFGLGNEQRAMQQLCASRPWVLTAGYFNIEESLRRALIANPNNGTVIVASPEANGFFESKGLSRHVPGLYSMLAANFRREAGDNISVREWRKGVCNQPGGWSYHAKGLWLYDSAENIDSTVIGSSNFTKRAYSHDLEAGALITTKDPTLQTELRAELDHLLEDTEPLTSSVEKPKLAHRLFVSVFGDRL